MPAVIRVSGKQTIIKLGESTSAASRSALVAQIQAQAAALSSATAESAAGPTYPNTAAGLAATVDGEAFAVDSGAGTITVYLNNAGVAVAQRKLATTEALASNTGGDLVGIRRPSPGAVLRTAHNKDLDTIHAFDYIPPGNHNAILNRTDANEWSSELQAWLDALVSEGRFKGTLGSGLYNLENGLAVINGLRLNGDSKGGTRLTYHGSDAAIRIVDGVVRGYNTSISDLRITRPSGARSGIGLDLISVSEADFARMIIDGFDTGVALHSGISGGAVYNNFTIVKAQNCGTGFSLYRDDDGAGSISSYTSGNRFIMCRANICDVGLDISGGNQNVWAHGNIEVCGLGFRITEPVVASVAANAIERTRFENNTNTGLIGAGVVYTILDDNPIISGPDVVDNGIVTQNIGTYNTQLHRRQSRRQHADGSFRFTRLATGGAQTPNLLVDDTNSIGSGVVIEARTVQTGADVRLFRGKYGPNPKVGVDINGKLMDLATTNGPTGAFTMPAAQTLTVPNACISANSRIFLQAANAAAAALMGSAKALYVTNRVAGVSFQINTSNAALATGGEVFWYWIVN